MKLLAREEFKTQVFAENKNKCLFCDKLAVDAHHIFDRKLWADGGYYLENGATVCSDHHWECEKTDISVEDIYKAKGLKEIIYPPGLDKNKRYDKWGNIILPNGKRQPGPLFYEDGVQKILKDKKHLFF